MNRTTLFLAPHLAIAALMAACASVPTTATTATATPAATSSVALTSSAPAAFDCKRLEVEIYRTEEVKRAAMQSEQSAWKAVIPIAVAARYAGGKAAATEADKQLGELGREFTRHGCARDGN